MQGVQQNILAVIGTRPEAIKLAPVIQAMQRHGAFDVKVCATGQHTDMVFPILDWFGISRDFTLDAMRHRQPLSHLAGRLLSGLHDVMETCKPEIVMVQGDTTSAFVGSLAAYYGYDAQAQGAPIRVAHVEAGLRTGDNHSPYPEEANRRLISPLAHWHFAPTREAAEALRREGIAQNIFVTGNTVIDALFETRDMLAATPLNPVSHIPQGAKIILVTSHRRENYGEGLHEICKAVRILAERYRGEGLHVVYPVHLNKQVQETVREALADVENVHLITPLGYPQFVALMQRAHVILTDSGGVQEEAPSLGKPVLVMRDTTERPEAVMAGTAKLVGADASRIIQETAELLDSELSYAKMAKAVNPYGDGRASRRIVQIISGDNAHSLSHHAA